MLSEWDMIFQRYLSRRTKYVKSHNDEAAYIFSKYFLSEEYMQSLGMVKPAYTVSEKILIPCGCDKILTYAKEILPLCSDEIQQYVYGFCFEIIKLCCLNTYLPPQICMGIICEFKSLYNVDFEFIRPKFDGLNSRKVLYYVVSIEALFEEKYI